ncbi:MAG: DUF4265 domain-containing protein [Gammaproteobacteria bacterium]|nr:DUF4265 domain-containing protein [Gammaproteobacteria bacterium]
MPSHDSRTKTLASATANPVQAEAPLTLSLIAGYRNDGEPVLEKIVVEAMTPATKEYRLLKSPVFVRCLAAGDKIRYPADNPAGYELIKRSGNLCIRVLRKEGIEEVANTLSPELELLDGTLDLQSPRVLVYSIHVSIGFQNIEILLDRVIGQFPGTVWYYGNVYDPADGVTPLDWWQEFLAPV